MASGSSATVTTILLLAIALCGCDRIEEQAIRHVVTAELMEKYKVSGEDVRLLEVRMGGDVPVVWAEIREGGRAGTKREVICRVERLASPSETQARWMVTTIEEGKAEPYDTHEPASKK